MNSPLLGKNVKFSWCLFTDTRVSCLPTTDVTSLIPVLTVPPTNNISITLAKSVSTDGKHCRKTRQNTHETNVAQGISHENISEEKDHSYFMNVDNHHEEKGNNLSENFSETDEQWNGEDIKRLKCRKLTTRKRWTCEICLEVVDAISLCFHVKLQTHLSTHFHFGLKENNICLTGTKFSIQTYDQTKSLKSKMSQLCKEIMENSATCKILRILFLRQRKIGNSQEMCQNAIVDSDKFKHAIVTLPDSKALYFCEICGKRYNSKGELKYHMELHKNKEAFKCDICQYNYSNPRSLKKHKLIRHGKGRPVVCEVCGEVVQFIYLQWHIKQKHKDLIVKKGCGEFLCSKCPRTFDTLSGLNKHDSLAHNSCASNFKLNEHKKEIERNKYKCQICFRTYETVKKKNQHMNSHSGIRPYRCVHCPKSFFTEHLLHKHQIVHQEKKFTCDVCDKKFRSKSQLKNHYTLHTGEKPYPCGVCGRRFRLNRDMHSHFKTHSEEDRKSVLKPETENPGLDSGNSMDIIENVIT